MRKLFIVFFICGGAAWAQTPPAIASIQGVERISVEAGGTLERLGSFLITNAEPAAFRLNVSFMNGCKLRRFGGSGTVNLNSIVVQTVDGTDLMPQWNRAGADCGAFAIDFVKPGAATSYDIEILGSWGAQGFNVLAGRFWESAILTLSNISY